MNIALNWANCREVRETGRVLCHNLHQQNLL
nr:MAG TPA: hypothetical protein [Caudoviricetes sp.]